MTTATHDDRRGGPVERIERGALLGIMRHAFQEAEQDPAKARAEMDTLAAANEPTTCALTAAKPAIPARFAGARLAQFRDALPSIADMAVRASQQAAFEAVTEWCRRVTAGEPAMLALMGPTGVGKSHLLYGAANALYHRNVRVYVQPWYRLADALRYGGQSAWTGKTLEAHEIRMEIMDERVICLDDLRATAGTAFDDTELGKVILDAYDREAAMLITTNVSPLTELLSAPHASRFTQVTLTGPDRRNA